MSRVVLSLPLLLVILGTTAPQSGCWGAKNTGQAPSNPTPVSVATPPKADLYGLVKKVDAAKRTVTLRVEKDGEKPEKTYEVAEDATILLEQPGQLADLAVGSRVALVFGADRQTAAEIRTEPFHIIVKPKTEQIKVNERLDVELHLVNASELTQTFHVMSCSWNDQWQSSNPDIKPGSWGCWGNVPQQVKLTPGEAHEKVLWMLAKAAGMVSFRMGFTPLDYKLGSIARQGKRTYWSNETTIEVQKSRPNIQDEMLVAP
jgi:hypothetical protein